MMVKEVLELVLEQKLNSDSYAHRLDKSAHDATQQARVLCWRWSWALYMDIKAYSDTVDHEPLTKAVRLHTDQRWVLLYTKHWLKAPATCPDGN